MGKHHILGTFLTLAAWSIAYVPGPTGIGFSSFQVGAVAQAGVRWTPNPDRGSASSTLSGGRRGASASACALDSSLPDPAITLLVPDGATGLTTEAQPTLSWYLESQQATDMEFVLSHPEQADPIYTKSVRAEAGLVEVILPASAALEVGTRYRWTVFATCNGGENEVHARSFVERVADSHLSAAGVADMTPLDRAHAYAAQGIWYDALNTLVSAYREDGQISTLLEIRDLLEQAKTEVPLDLSLATAS
ncbi:MAG: DUF928 domain-containing protein [Phormidesmis sp. RL_2_1]|nr:DUF928 domain-containing protein [Phormidesmis sp. RL_2_1]